MLTFHVLSHAAAVVRLPVFAACNAAAIIIASASRIEPPTTASTEAAAKATPASCESTATSNTEAHT